VEVRAVGDPREAGRGGADRLLGDRQRPRRGTRVRARRSRSERVHQRRAGRRADVGDLQGRYARPLQLLLRDAVQHDGAASPDARRADRGLNVVSGLSRTWSALMKRHPLLIVAATVAATLAIAHTTGCGASRSARSLAADKVYVAPGELDKYYAFLSGGQSGSVFVVGIPSGRLIREIPVFEQRAAYGYAMNDADPRRQELLDTGGAWGDTHHPVLSETDGMPNGKYLWINDLANARLARVRLDYFETDRLLKLPNLQGAHGIAVVSPNTTYIVVNGEFEQPTDG